MENIREKALETIKKQKSSWLALGELLFEIFSNEKYVEWGHEKFKDYVEQELGITHSQAKQVLSAYEYIKNNNPNLLNMIEKDPSTYVPDFQTISALKNYNDKTEDEEKKKQFEEKVFSGEVCDTTVKKEMRDEISKKFNNDGNEILDDIEGEAKKIRNSLKRLNSKIQECSLFENEILQKSEELLALIDKVVI